MTSIEHSVGGDQLYAYWIRPICDGSVFTGARSPTGRGRRPWRAGKVKNGGVEDEVALAKLDVGDAGFLHELVSCRAPSGSVN